MLALTRHLGLYLWLGTVGQRAVNCKSVWGGTESRLLLSHHHHALHHVSTYLTKNTHTHTHTHSRAFLHRNYTHLSLAMPHTSACPECSLVTINIPSFCRRTKGFHKKPPSHSVLGIGLYLRPGLFNSFGLFEHRSKNFMHFRCGDITVLLRSL